MSRNLSALTDKPAPRGQGLAGSLPALRPSQTAIPAEIWPAAEAPDNDGPATTATPEAPAPEVKSRTANKPRANRADTTTPTAQTRTSTAPLEETTVGGALGAVVVYLPAALLAQVKAAKIAAHQAYTEWVLDQLDRNWDALAEAFVKPAARRSPLPPRGPSRRREVQAPQALQLRMTADELAVVDARAEEVAAGSRSAFITAIAELALTKN